MKRTRIFKFAAKISRKCVVKLFSNRPRDCCAIAAAFKKGENNISETELLYCYF